MNKLKSKEWWEAAGVRALKTVAETALGIIGTSVLLQEVNWLGVASASVLAGVASLLWSLKGIPEVSESEENNESTQIATN